MRSAPNGFRERPSTKPVEIEIEIKRATAENIAYAQGVLNQKAEEFEKAKQLLHAEMRSLLTERGIEQGEVIKITDTKPCKLVVRVLKYAKAETTTKK